MIDSLSALGSYNYTSSSTRSSSDSSLSLDQQETIQDVLSNYDSNNLSSSDALEIVSAFQNANIEPSRSFENALSSLGFDAKEIGDLAGVGPQGQGGMPPPPPPKESEDEISDILSELLYGDDEDDDNTNTSNSNAYNSNSTTFDSVLDYTSRILSLNDDAKNQVMDLFENYKPDSTQLSSSDVSNIIKNSLQDILSNENNYNSTSFYA
ncbi:hypothetical protein [Arcobacter roscoffensis]|uniref:Uncharacterized protein n=1 Tax=Arcobacter roscoffensis TaxID=2961520 RepID=A0ABY5DZU1_9BACT|nr:hypothetical protein [Arcobacter roscoffensis]UTJ05477.1 hypothetical protein NJU99_09380 [Arcobacter roscoffensis]